LSQRGGGIDYADKGLDQQLWFLAMKNTGFGQRLWSGNRQTGERHLRDGFPRDTIHRLVFRWNDGLM